MNMFLSKKGVSLDHETLQKIYEKHPLRPTGFEGDYEEAHFREDDPVDDMVGLPFLWYTDEKGV